MTPPTAKSILKVLILMVFGSLILEQIVRFYLFGSASLSITKMNSVTQFGSSGLIKPTIYPRLIYELRPNLDTYHQLVRFKTNSKGLRDKEYVIDKPKDAFRIAVLGDSVTMALGVEIENAFHSIIEERLNRESPGTLYEAINFGVAGYDPTCSVSNLQHRAMKYSPDLVCFCLSEPFEFFFEERRYAQPFQPKPQAHAFFGSFLLNLAKAKIAGERRLLQKESYEVSKAKREKRTEEVFRELGEISREHNLPVCIVLLTCRTYKDSVVLRDLAAKYSLYFVDTSPRFIEKRLVDYFIYRTNQHPNAKANEIFADVIYNYLKEEKLVCEP